MKRFILLFFVTFFAIDLVQAQDIIVPKDKTKSRLTVVLTKVSQETNGVVEYKDYNNQEGPTYSMPWNQINMIITIDGATIYPPVAEEKIVYTKEKEKSVVIGFVAGMNMSNFKYKYSGRFIGSVLNYGYGEEIGEKPNYKSEMGYNFGATLDIKLVNNFFLKTGLVYSNHRVSNKFNKSYYDESPYNLVGHGDAIGGYIIPEGMVIEGLMFGYMYDQFEENYSLNYLNVPILASYRLPLTKNKKLNVQFNAGFNVGIGLSGKLNYSGYNTSEPDLNSNNYSLDFISYDLYNVDGSYEYVYIEDLIHKISYYEGNVDLFSGDGSYDYRYVTGATGSENINCENPYKRLNLGLNLGFDVEFSGVYLGFSYTLGLNNYANSSFWKNDRAQITDYAGNGVKDYKQRTNSLNITLGYKIR